MKDLNFLLRCNFLLKFLLKISQDSKNVKCFFLEICFLEIVKRR